MTDEMDAQEGKAIIPQEPNQQLSLPADLVRRGLELSAKLEQRQGIQNYLEPIAQSPAFLTAACIAFSKNGEWAAITGYGKGAANSELATLNIFKSDLSIRYAPPEKPSFYHSVAISKSGEFALTGYMDGRIRIWDIKKGTVDNLSQVEQEHYQHSVDAIVFSPDDRLFAESCGPRITIREAHSGKAIQSFDGYNTFYNQLAFSEDGSQLLSAHGEQATYKNVWGSFMTLFDLSGRQKARFFGGERIMSFCAVAIFPDNQKVVSIDDNGQIAVWEAASGDEMACWAHVQPPAEVSNVVSEEKRPGNLTFVMTNPTVWGFSSLAVSPDGQRILSGGADTFMRLWTVDGRLVYAYPHKKRVVKTAFSLDGLHALAGCWDGSVYVWNAPGY